MPTTYTQASVDHADVELPLPGEPVRTDGIAPAIMRTLDKGKFVQDALATEASTRSTQDAATLASAEAYTDLETARALAAEQAIKDAMPIKGFDFNTVGTHTWTATFTGRLILNGCGNGGGGGGGGHGNAIGGQGGIGGGGGGGARERTCFVDVVLGTVYEVVIQAAAGGGAENTAGTDGDDVIFREQGGATLATFRGAGGGPGGSVTSAASASTIGGGPPTKGFRANFPPSATSGNRLYSILEQQGGEGVYNMAPADGNPSPSGYVGGTAGTNGGAGAGDGGGGGGGGAGPRGNGANGGNGGHTTDGGGGTAALAGTGAGGGGGGGGEGATGGAVHAGGPGGAGGCGYVSGAYESFT